MLLLLLILALVMLSLGYVGVIVEGLGRYFSR
jgi:hypothetical protein